MISENEYEIVSIRERVKPGVQSFCPQISRSSKVGHFFISLVYRYLSMKHLEMWDMSGTNSYTLHY